MSTNEKAYREALGKRVLLEWGIRSLLECVIVEVSPSGERAKIKTDAGTQWVDVWQHDIKEVLETKMPTLSQTK